MIRKLYIIALLLAFSLVLLLKVGVADEIRASQINLLTLRIVQGEPAALGANNLPDLTKDEAETIKASLPLRRAWARLLLATGQNEVAGSLLGGADGVDCTLALLAGIGLSKAGNEQAAVDYWRPCANAVYYFVNQGLHAEGIGELETAKAMYRAAISTQSTVNDPSVAYYLLIQLEGKDRGWQDAIVDIMAYQRAVQSGTVQYPTFFGRAGRYSDMWTFISIGHHLRLASDSCQDAVFWYGLAQSRSPESAFPRIYLGVCTSNRDGKIAHFKSAIELEPQNAIGYYWLGATLKSEGDCAQAMRFLSKATEFDHEYINAWFLLAECNEELGDISSAVEAYKVVLALKPDHERAKAAIGRLER